MMGAASRRPARAATFIDTRIHDVKQRTALDHGATSI
jgi:hypothetical protein